MRKTQRRIRVLLVDDHAVVRAGYKMLLANAPEIQIVGEADSGEQAQRIFAQQTPDLAIMDLCLSGISGIETTRRIVSRWPEARILVVSMHDSPAFVEQSLQAGALGYLTKAAAPEMLVQALRRIAAGESFIDPELAQQVAFLRLKGNGSPFNGLSNREFEIIRLLAEGASLETIAGQLALSYKTVANYQFMLKRKLKLSSIAEITRLAIRHGLINP